jgi:hypothetical protein|uniref:DUF3098 domain-containing protein n=1 Tax=candidate division WOR-3 bacterium TaxID=2052148 RepID=A0A7V3PT04_UNCW3
MKKKDARIRRTVKSVAKVPAGPQLAFKPKNYLLLGAGLLTIIAGFISLNAGSITLAPVLLIAGYCVLIPLALLLK